MIYMLAVIVVDGTGSTLSLRQRSFRYNTVNPNIANKSNMRSNWYRTLLDTVIKLLCLMQIIALSLTFKKN